MTEDAKVYIREYQRAWRDKNRERSREINRKWAKLHPELVKQKNAVQRAKRKEKMRAYFSSPEVKLRRAEWMRKWRATPEGAIVHSLRNRLRRALRGRASAGHTMELVGCSASELKSWLEGWFDGRMSWDNYGQWHIDHNRPCDSFNLCNPEHQRRCFHYLNLRPLWACDNLSKGSQYPAIKVA